jgi:hypothetical protein
MSPTYMTIQAIQRKMWRKQPAENASRYVPFFPWSFTGGVCNKNLDIFQGGWKSIAAHFRCITGTVSGE